MKSVIKSFSSTVFLFLFKCWCCVCVCACVRVFLFSLIVIKMSRTIPLSITSFCVWQVYSLTWTSWSRPRGKRSSKSSSMAWSAWNTEAMIRQVKWRHVEITNIRCVCCIQSYRVIAVWAKAQSIIVQVGEVEGALKIKQYSVWTLTVNERWGWDGEGVYKIEG